MNGFEQIEINKKISVKEWPKTLLYKWAFPGFFFVSFVFSQHSDNHRMIDFYHKWKKHNWNLGMVGALLYFFEWVDPRLFNFIFVFSIQLTVNKCSLKKFANDWIQTDDLGPQLLLCHTV